MEDKEFAVKQEPLFQFSKVFMLNREENKAARYWTAKDDSVNIAGLESKLDKLFELFVKYLSGKGITIEPGYFTITDGFRSIEKQLYYILKVRRSGQSTYSGFINHSKNKAIFSKILLNAEIGSKAADAKTNQVIKTLKEDLEERWGSEEKLIEAMAGMYHVVRGGTDVSINDSKGCATMLDDSAFKSQTEVKNIVKSIDIHAIGDPSSKHVHIIFL